MQVERGARLDIRDTVYNGAPLERELCAGGMSRVFLADAVVPGRENSSVGRAADV